LIANDNQEQDPNAAPEYDVDQDAPQYMP
jgi:hypothetical protein